jgi:glycosyltransferase involved in cell wall biosynthesis
VSRRLRIASFYRTLGTGGDENRLLSFARTLDRSRFDHTVAVAFPPGADEAGTEGPMLAEYRQAGVEVTTLEEDPLPTDRAGALAALTQVVGRLAGFLREREIDVLDARLAGAIPLATIAGRLAGTPAVVGTQYHFAGWDRPTRRAIAEACWPRLRALVCDSRARLEEMQRFLSRPPRGVVIPNGIAPPSSRRSPAEMRCALGLPEAPEVRVVGQLSRLVRFKGHSVLLEAARSVLAQHPKTVFLLCGFAREDGYEEELTRRACALGIADRVRITSYPGPAADVWQAIDVHVHASLFDSSPLAILEGMALGKPAAVTAVGGIPELVEDERTGLVVPPGQPDALAGALMRLLQDREGAAKLGEAARRRYERHHRAEIMARATEGLFEELCR